MMMSALSDGGCRARRMSAPRPSAIDRRRRGPFEANRGPIKFTESPAAFRETRGIPGKRNLKRKTVQTVTNQRAGPGLMGTTSHPVKARKMAAGKPALYFHVKPDPKCCICASGNIKP